MSVSEMMEATLEGEQKEEVTEKTNQISCSKAKMDESSSKNVKWVESQRKFD